MALRGVYTHRKTRMLAALLALPIPMAVGLMEGVWHATAAHAPNGAIGRLSNEEIGMELWWDGDVAGLLAAMAQVKLLDAHPLHRFIVHNWHKRSDSSADARLARQMGERYANGAQPRGEKLSTPEKKKFKEFWAAQPGTSLFPEARPEPVATPVAAEPVASQPPTPVASAASPVSPAVPVNETGRATPMPDLRGVAREIVCAHPHSAGIALAATDVREAQIAAVERAIWREHRRTGTDVDVEAALLLVHMRGVAEVVRQWPPGGWQFFPGVQRFFDEMQYRRPAEEWQRGTRGQGEDGTAARRPTDGRGEHGAGGARRSAAEERSAAGNDAIRSAFPDLEAWYAASAADGGAAGDWRADGADQGELSEPDHSAGDDRAVARGLDGDRAAAWAGGAAGGARKPPQVVEFSAWAARGADRGRASPGAASG